MSCIYSYIPRKVGIIDFMTSQKELVEYLRDATSVLQTPHIESAFRAVNRAYFVPETLEDEAYEDCALPIGFGATISQPTTVAFMLEKLDAREGQKILDVGSGSGWTTALLAHLVGPKGKVIGVEIVPELVAFGRNNLARYYSYIRTNVGTSEERGEWVSNGHVRAEIRQAEQREIGLPNEAPFDRILVSAAAEQIPQELVAQLKPGGKMVLPIGSIGIGHTQSLTLVEKQKNGYIKHTAFPGFAFVPLR